MLLEFFAILFTLFSVWFGIKQNQKTWIFGIVGLICYFFIFFNSKLYAESVLQIIFFIQSLYGLYNWNRHKYNFKVKSIDLIQKTKILTSSLFLIFISYIILIIFTDSKYPFLDSSSTILSIYANYLLANKKLEAWILWIIVDILLILLFFINDMYMSMALYMLFLFLAIKGYIEWKRSINQV